MTKDNIPTEIAGYKYISKADHRDNTPTKSQWTVSVADEHACFDFGVGHGWVSTSGDSAWGLHVIDGKADYLGKSAPGRGPEASLFVAFFQLADVCHGCPSDLKRSRREIPPTSVTRAWLEGKYLRGPVIRKLQLGQTCSL